MTGKKIVVTGSRGLLGSSLVSNLNFRNIIGFRRDQLDVLDYSIINKKLNKEKPDIIIHTAAYTNVESCEIDKDNAYKVNVLGTQNLVNYCINKDILFIYLSSTGIYGSGKNELYTEFDQVNPTTVHHKSKYEGENIVRNHLNKFLIIRTGWLYGGDKTSNKNFVYQRFLESSKSSIIFSDDSQIGNPTYVVELVEQIYVLIKNGQYGIYNCVNSATNISRYDYVKKIIELYEIDCEVKIAPKNMFKRIAPVSKNESAINFKLNLLGLNIMGDWENSLIKYIELLKQNK